MYCFRGCGDLSTPSTIWMRTWCTPYCRRYCLCRPRILHSLQAVCFSTQDGSNTAFRPSWQHRSRAGSQIEQNNPSPAWPASSDKLDQGPVQRHLARRSRIWTAVTAVCSWNNFCEAYAIFLTTATTICGTNGTFEGEGGGFSSKRSRSMSVRHLDNLVQKNHLVGAHGPRSMLLTI